MTAWLYRRDLVIPLIVRLVARDLATPEPLIRGERPEMLIDSILHQHPRLDQDLFQMDAQVWAILGYTPVDGEVILAEFDHRETARAVLAQLAPAQDRDGNE